MVLADVPLFRFAGADSPKTNPFATDPMGAMDSAPNVKLASWLRRNLVSNFVATLSRTK